VEGSLRTRKWQNKEGVDQYTTEIVASEMQMLDSRGGPGGDYSPAPDDNYTPSQPQSRAPQQSSAPTQNQPAAESSGFGDFDDDIPF